MAPGLTWLCSCDGPSRRHTERRTAFFLSGCLACCCSCLSVCCCCNSSSTSAGNSDRLRQIFLGFHKTEAPSTGRYTEVQRRGGGVLGCTLTPDSRHTPHQHNRLSKPAEMNSRLTVSNSAVSQRGYLCRERGHIPGRMKVP